MEAFGSLQQMALSLAAVVVMILGLAWLARRMQGLRAGAVAGGEVLRVRASLAVGLKERVVIVEAQGQQFLVGVAPGQVSILKALGPVPAVSPVSSPQPSPTGAPHPQSDLPNFGQALALQLRQVLRR